jgi:hypothetical protein
MATVMFEVVSNSDLRLTVEIAHWAKALLDGAAVLKVFEQLNDCHFQHHICLTPFVFLTLVLNLVILKLFDHHYT